MKGHTSKLTFAKFPRIRQTIKHSKRCFWNRPRIANSENAEVTRNGSWRHSKENMDWLGLASSLSHMFSNVNCTTVNLEKVNTITAGYFMTGVLMLGTDPTLSFKHYGNPRFRFMWTVSSIPSTIWDRKFVGNLEKSIATHSSRVPVV